MNFLTESDIKYLKNCVLHSTLLGHEVEKGNEVLRKLDEALNIANVAGQSEQSVCKCSTNNIGAVANGVAYCEDCDRPKAN